MRIGIEAQRLLRPHKHGMDFVALELIHALQQIDTQNEYFIFVRPDTDESCLRLGPRFTLVKVAGLNYVHWEQVALPLAVRAYQLDLLHCTANTGPLWGTTPQILTLHDVLFRQPTSGPNTATLYQRLGNGYRSLLLPALLKRCRVVLTVSNYARQQIQAAFALPPERLSVLYNGLGPLFTRPITRQQGYSTRRRYTLPARYFLFLGSADPRKNMVGVLRAYLGYRQFDPSVGLVVSGRHYSFLHRVLTAQEYQAVEQHCRFVGYIHDDDLPSLYAMAEAFLFPSLSEGFGLPILEAMACGTPVVTSQCTAMPEVAGSAAVLVDPHQPAAITRALQQLMADADLRRTMIRRGQAWARRFSWQETAHQLLHHYQQVYQPVYQPGNTKGLHPWPLTGPAQATAGAEPGSNSGCPSL